MEGKAKERLYQLVDQIPEAEEIGGRRMTQAVLAPLVADVQARPDSLVLRDDLGGRVF